MTIPLSVPHLSGNEWKYIKECLDTEWVSSVGKYVDRFEKDIREYVGIRYSVACMNGTAALQIALSMAGVNPDDEVIVPTITFIAPVNVVRYLGAEPVFMDCDLYYNLDAEKTLDFIEKETVFQNGRVFNRKSGRRVAAIIPVHVFGNAVNLEPLLEPCKKRGIKVIEDAAESMGTRYSKGKLAGKHTGTAGDIGCYSFNGNKIITTGGGGVLVTGDETMADKMRYLTNQAKDDPVRYIHNEIGYNFRMTNLQAALGVAQLEELPKFLEIKKKNFRYYQKNIEKIPGLHLGEVPDYADNNHWMYTLQIDPVLYGHNREELMFVFSENGIQTRPVWYLNHLQRPYKNCLAYRVERAPRMLETTLNIPCSVNLTQENMDEVLRILKNV
ncbi:MAG: LegC family aminotransferase [Candidatus Aminicenantes bacterium]|nr:LegC family aminotransferase [Candidatus Aminicenantes bacterium]